MVDKPAFTHLESQRFIAVTTYRKSGKAVITPVWFVQQGDRLLIWTAKDSGKAKRLRSNPCLRLGPSDHGGKLLGPLSDGVARFLPESEYPVLKKAFRAKYGWQEWLFSLLWKIQKHEHAYIEIREPHS